MAEGKTGSAGSAEVTEECEFEETTASKLVEFEGSIGFKKGNSFIAMTNFSLECVGYVKGDGVNIDGFMFCVRPKSVDPSHETEQDQSGCNGESYFLTCKEMSSQVGIMNKLSKKNLWTAPSKDQYLPAYVKMLSDQYLSSTSPRFLHPVKIIGLQKDSDPPTWVLGKNLTVSVNNGKAKILSEEESTYCVLEDFCRIPMLTPQTDLDHGEGLIKLVEFQQEVFQNNFPAALLVLGGTALAVHYEQLSKSFHVPPIMALGEPITCKSTAVETALSLFGVEECVGETTLPALLEIGSKRTIPFWWDDVENVVIMEKVACMAFNKSSRRTQFTEVRFKTVPIMTMNPELLKKKKMNGSNALRLFSRLLVIPFMKGNGELTLTERLGQQELEASAKRAAKKSVGIILELCEQFKDIKTDPVFGEVDQLLANTSLDPRTKMNYGLLLYSTGKVLEKIGLKERHFPIFKDWLTEVLLPCYQLLIAGNQGSPENKSAEAPKECDVEAIIIQILRKAAEKPEEAKAFMKPNTSSRSCLCGPTVLFSVEKATEFVGAPKGMGDAIRSWVKQGNGCTGRKINRSDNTQLHGVHIKRRCFEEDLLDDLDKAFSSSTKNSMQSKKVPPGKNQATASSQRDKTEDLTTPREDSSEDGKRESRGSGDQMSSIPGSHVETSGSGRQNATEPAAEEKRKADSDDEEKTIAANGQRKRIRKTRSPPQTRLRSGRS